MAEAGLDTSMMQKYVDRLQAGDRKARNELLLAAWIG
jgi:hypothetical protein